MLSFNYLPEVTRITEEKKNERERDRDRERKLGFRNCCVERREYHKPVSKKRELVCVFGVCVCERREKERKREKEEGDGW